MIKMRKIMNGFLLLLALSLCLSAPAEAKKKPKKTKKQTEQQTTSKKEQQQSSEDPAPVQQDAEFVIDVKTDIALSETDVFYVTVQSDTTERMLELKGNTCGEDVFNLPQGVYSTKSIEYKGKNQEIYMQGYGFSKQFTLAPSQFNRVSLAVGRGQLEMGGTSLLAVSGLAPNNSAVQDTSYTTETTENTDADTTTQDTSAGDDSTEVLQDSVEETKDPDKEDIVEKPKKKKAPRKSIADRLKTVFYKILFCIAFGGVLLATSYYVFRDKFS